MTAESKFWIAVSGGLSGRLHPAERVGLRIAGYLEEYINGPERKVVAEAVELVRKLRFEEGYSVAEVWHPGTAPDGRWDLLRDLDTDFGSERGDTSSDRWEPLTVTGRVMAQDREPPAQRVVISFDHRLSQRALIAAIRRNWPAWRRARWVRWTQPLGPRKIALINHVCRVCEPGIEWDERLTLWNEAQPNWRYPDRRQFVSAFRSAEESLTGERRGLEWFYDPISRVPIDELRALAAESPAAKGRLLVLFRELVLNPSLERRVPRTEVGLAQSLGVTVAKLREKAPGLVKALSRRNKRKPSHVVTSFIRGAIAESYDEVAVAARARGESLPNTEDVMPELVGRMGPEIMARLSAQAVAAAEEVGLLRVWLGLDPAGSADEEANSGKETR